MLINWLFASMKSYTENNKIDRRKFINYLLAILSAPAILWWLYVGRRNEKIRGGEKRIFVGKELPNGVNFIGSAILVNINQEARAYYAKCTHLGCQIKKLEGDILVCQCHGSRFDLSGKPTKGPAIKSLRELHISKDNSGNYSINK